MRVCCPGTPKEDITMKKTSRRMLSVLLALVLMLSVLPLAASAASVQDWTWRLITRDTTEYHFEDSTYVIYDNSSGWITASTHEDYDAQVTDQYNPGESAPVIRNMDRTHVHLFGLEMNRDGHYTGCICGARQDNITPHVDPRDAVDGRCTCGYKFMDNADLSVLWISNVTLDSAFDPDDIEYNATLVNKDAKAVNISAFTSDARAELEVSGDMILKSGANVISLKVTAEDGKTAKTYTVTVVKE